MRWVMVDQYKAVGGPANTSTGRDGFEAGPTDAGTYALSYCGQHSSARYPNWSKIRWGSPLRERTPGDVEVLHDGKWQKLSSLTSESIDMIKNYHFRLYGTRALPKTWVFNDFGHLTCYYFEDVNKNRKLDGKEKLSGEFIHTTPINEAQTSRGQAVGLEPSHGCIHVMPRDVDDMRAKGYLAKGTTVVVHDYSARSRIASPSSRAKKPFEVHFYPGDQTIVVYGQE
jgi:hypothetical protein